MNETDANFVEEGFGGLGYHAGWWWEGSAVQEGKGRGWEEEGSEIGERESVRLHDRGCRFGYGQD